MAWWKFIELRRGAAVDFSFLLSLHIFLFNASCPVSSTVYSALQVISFRGSALCFLFEVVSAITYSAPTTYTVSRRIAFFFLVSLLLSGTCISNAPHDPWIALDRLGYYASFRYARGHRFVGVFRVTTSQRTTYSPTSLSSYQLSRFTSVRHDDLPFRTKVNYSSRFVRVPLGALRRLF